MIYKGLTLITAYKSYKLFIISNNDQLDELYHLCLEVHCIKYELSLFLVKAFLLFNLIMTLT